MRHRQRLFGLKVPLTFMPNNFRTKNLIHKHKRGITQVPRSQLEELLERTKIDLEEMEEMDFSESSVEFNAAERDIITAKQIVEELTRILE